jgi:hypothetical protein
MLYIRWDLCAGPHVESTGKINGNALELENVAGAYWRGDENKQVIPLFYICMLDFRFFPCPVMPIRFKSLFGMLFQSCCSNPVR